MIESNIINWIDISDSMQNLDVYGHKKWLHFFDIMRVLVGYKTFSVFFFIILKFLFFLQIIMLCLVNTESEGDSAVQILKYISNVILIQGVITSKGTYTIALCVVIALTLIICLSCIYLMISIKMGKLMFKEPILFFNIINVAAMDFLIGPIVQIGIMAFNCNKGQHIYLNNTCYVHWLHWVVIVISVINTAFWIVFSIILSIYYNEIGSINETKVCARVNCNYEFFMNICKIAMFIFAYISQTFGKDSEIFRIIFEVYMFINTLGFSFYVYKEVFFYNPLIQCVVQYGWVFTCWFSLIILLKSLLSINDTSIFHLVGWFILALIMYFLEESRREYLLTDFNIFEIKSMKDIELFNYNLMSLINQRSVKAKTLLVGITEKFADFARQNPEINEKYIKLNSNDNLKKQFNSNSALPILSIIYILYDHHLDRSILKNDILLNMCYFLMNKFKNPTFAVNLCSKFKVEGHKHLYFKFVLMEEIKEFFVNKLSKSSNKESIKHVEVGSVILYNIYMDLFKIKIYDAACNQIDYFDLLKNGSSNPKTAENFLKIGEDILTLRKEILQIWNKIIDLNPFSDESERDYMLYLQTILQDDILVRTETKKYSTLRNNKLSERNNIYHSMFIRETSSVVLIDGYSASGKFLYTTPNFPNLFNFSGKEVLNLGIDDLIPNVVAGFHKDLIDNAIKYSNINYIFNVQKDFLLKGKTGGIFNIKLYTKTVPNLSYGLIYMVQIAKSQDHHFIIVLDRDFKINGLTDMASQGGEMYTMNNNYGLTQGLCGHHIALALPEILTQMEYINDEFHVKKGDIDLKGSLYPVSVYKDLDNKVEAVLSKIKQFGKISLDDNNDRNDGKAEYDDLLREINTRYQKSHSIFYKIITKTFMDGKHKYYRVYITNDLIALNENSFDKMTMLLSANSKKAGHNNQKSIHNGKASKASQESSGKQIKLKLGEKSKKEEGLLQEERAKGEGEHKGEGEEENKKDEHNKLGLDGGFSKPSHTPSSLYTRSSLDSASFNKLKNGILDKKEVSTVKIMRILCVVFVILTIVLIVADSFIIEQNFEQLRDYLQQNLFFNHSKISVSCIYLSTLNLKWVKDGYIHEDACDLNSTCSLFYSQLLSDCIDDMKIQKENSSTFYDDFRSILKVAKDIQLDVFNLTFKDTLSIDMSNLLNLLISNGLKLNSNLELYYEGENIYDINSLNLLDQSLNFLTDTDVVGFDNNQKKNKIDEHFSPKPIALIIDCIFVVCIFFAFGYMIFNLNKMEEFYLEKLIKFHPPNFEAYLKTLEELKKKLRNENGEEEDKMNGELDLGENSSKKGSKLNENEETKKGKHAKNKKDQEEDDDESKSKEQQNRRNRRKKQKGSRDNKAQRQRNEKIKIMAKFFFTWNVILILKILFVLLISFSYYIIVSFIEANKKTDYLEFDGTTDAIEGVYKNSFDIFLSLKTELALYENYEVERKKVIAKLQKDPTKPIEFNGKNYTKPEDVLNLPSYYMSIPNNNEIVTPKLGNLLMPLVNDLNGASDATKELNDLYNNDACLVLFEDPNEGGYNSCSMFWSGIVLKGMEQSITQMSVVINTVIDEMNSLNVEGMNVGGSSGENQEPNDINNAKNTFENLLKATSSFSQYEVFVEYYLFNAYMKTVELFSDLKKIKVKTIYDTFRIILYCYIVGIALLFLILLYFVYSSKSMFNTFLNFVGIVPVKYLMEDEQLYKDVLRLEQHIF